MPPKSSSSSSSSQSRDSSKKQNNKGKKHHKDGKRGGNNGGGRNNRQGRADRAKETVQIMETGRFAVDGAEVDIAQDIKTMVDNTRVYLDEAKVYPKIDLQASTSSPIARDAEGGDAQHPKDKRNLTSVVEAYPDNVFQTAPPKGNAPSRPAEAPPTVFELVEEPTLSCAKRLLATHATVGVLNFASAKNPGGGFLRGSLAQEESLAIASALYASQTSAAPQDTYYCLHRSAHLAEYSHTMIFHPAVPFFRTASGALTQPFHLDVLTSCAVNTNISYKRGVAKDVLDRLMQERINRILRIFLDNNQRVVVLGAYGCGVFGNEAADVARMFRQALLSKEFRNQFTHVAFAIIDLTKSANGKAFLSTFGDVATTTASDKNSTPSSSTTTTSSTSSTTTTSS